MFRLLLYPLVRLLIGTGASLIKYLWRYLITGRELFGPGDNATLWLDATEDYRKRPVEKLTRARWRRLARRWAILGFPALLALLRALAGQPYGYVLGAYVLTGVTGGLSWVGYAAHAWWPQRETRKTYIYPAGRVLAKILGMRFKRRDALTCIQLPDRFTAAPDEDGEPPLPVRIYLPDVPLDKGVKDRIVAQVGARLGLPEATAKWTEVGKRVFVELFPAALPPARLTFAEVARFIEGADADHPFVGVMNGNRPSYMDFVNDSPHSMGSAGSGAGKSTFYKLIAMQRLHHGAAAIMLDFKKWSHIRWMGRLPGGFVQIEDTIPGMHRALAQVLDELLFRKSFNLDQEEELKKLRRIDVYVEEANTMTPMLAEYWKMEVAKRRQEARRALRLAKEAEDEIAIEDAENELAAAMGLPQTSPAIQALRWGVNLGREFGIHFHVIGQSLDANAMGGRNTRASFRTRFLARWDAKDWKMLADGVPFHPCPSGTVGIWAHVHGRDVDIIRVPFVSDEDAIRHVLSGTGHGQPIFTPRRVAIEDSVPVVDQDMSIEGSVCPVPVVSGPTTATLRDLVEMLPDRPDGSRLSMKALRQAAGREGFPQPVAESVESGKAYQYVIDDVLSWFRSREGLLPELTQ